MYPTTEPAEGLLRDTVIVSVFNPKNIPNTINKSIVVNKFAKPLLFNFCVVLL